MMTDTINSMLNGGISDISKPSKHLFIIVAVAVKGNWQDKDDLQTLCNHLAVNINTSQTTPTSKSTFLLPPTCTHAISTTVLWRIFTVRISVMSSPFKNRLYVWCGGWYIHFLSAYIIREYIAMRCKRTIEYRYHDSSFWFEFTRYENNVAQFMEEVTMEDPSYFRQMEYTWKWTFHKWTWRNAWMSSGPGHPIWNFRWPVGSWSLWQYGACGPLSKFVSLQYTKKSVSA